jgi:hypothetical protein
MDVRIYTIHLFNLKKIKNKKKNKTNDANLRRVFHLNFSYNLFGDPLQYRQFCVYLYYPRKMPFFIVIHVKNLCIPSLLRFTSFSDAMIPTFKL